jgi:ABC-2 type transport system ATP-binding protein
MSAVIALEQLSKRFGKVEAVEDLSLEVPEGCVFGFLGRNGAGKTTTIRMMLGLLPPDSGQCAVLGLDSRKKGVDIRRRVGYVPETHHIYRWMTVGEVAWFCSSFYPTWKKDECARLLKEFELDPAAKVRNLSKGALAKVALTLALAHDPEILILDEPTGGLDVIVRKEFLESIVKLIEQRGKTVFISSHLLDDVERVADRIAVIDKGRLKVAGEVDELKKRITNLRIIFKTAPSQAPPKSLPSVAPEDILKSELSGREWDLTIANFSDEILAHLKSAFPAAQVETHRPTLEEMFIALVGRNEGAGFGVQGSGTEEGGRQ